MTFASKPLPDHSSIDLLVIGGGINGTGIAADAAGRGLSVVLCEQNDLAAGTSSASSKMIHGGLRYLEHNAFRLVQESLKEQMLLLKHAPHLVHPQRFILPHCEGLRPLWILRLGLFLYDHLNLQRPLPSSQGLKLSQTEGLKPSFQKALQYFDCTVNDSRLVCHVALQAKQKGAHIFTNIELSNTVRHSDHWSIRLRHRNSASNLTLHPKVIVNATGPWVTQVATDLLGIQPQYQLQWVQGSHLILPKLVSHDAAYLLQHPDGRVIFVIPHHRDYHLVGTTDRHLEQLPENPEISKEEIDYLCQSVNQFFQTPISPQQILSTYSGVRALHGQKGTPASKISREFALDFQHSKQQAAVISIFGGKLTTYRSLAETVISQLKSLFPHMKPAWTHQAELPGGNFPSWSALGDHLSAQYPWLSKDLLYHFIKNYGTRAFDVIGDSNKIEDLGIHFGSTLYQREVDFLRAEEWADHPEDILKRRGHFELKFTEKQKMSLSNYLNPSCD